MTSELSEGGDKLIVDGIVTEGGARLIELREGRPVFMESDPIDRDGN